ncbi:hypothetical protein [Bordetella trematum]|uniref:hypothetical protein n=1 Tax=Bordetella trematum TaxID=123899 RepID=UPI001267FA4B|nr:hypothetical protein [Bordetella trematum]
MESSRWESLKQWYIEWSPWIAGGLILFNVAFFAGVLSIDAGRFLGDSPTIGWAGAIATASATIAAIWIALRRTREQQEKARRSGLLYFATLYPLFMEWADELKETISYFDANLHISLEARLSLKKSIDRARALDLEAIDAHSEKAAAFLSIAIGQCHAVMAQENSYPGKLSPKMHALLVRELSSGRDFIVALAHRSNAAKKIVQTIAQYPTKE